MQRKLSQKATEEPEHTFDDLYSLLCNEVWLRVAHHKVNANQGRETAGIDWQSMSNFNGDLEGNLESLRVMLKAKTFEPLPVRRVYIPKANGKKRPLGIPMGHAYCTPSNALWVSEWGQAGETGPPSIRAIPYVGECRGLRCRTGLRKAAIHSGVRVIQRGWCGASWRYSSWPALHH